MPGKPLSDGTIDWHVEELQVALTKRNRQLGQLTRPDGRPLFSDIELQERQQSLQAPIDELVTAKRELTYTEVQEAEQEIENIAASQANPVARLNTDELGRAASLRGFHEADVRRYPAADLAPQVAAAAAGKDRGLQAAWWHALLGRISELNSVAEGRQRSAQEIRESEQLAGMVDQLATVLRDPALDATRKEQEKRIDQARAMRRKIDDLVRPAEIDALAAGLRASGQYARF